MERRSSTVISRPYGPDAETVPVPGYSWRPRASPSTGAAVVGVDQAATRNGAGISHRHHEVREQRRSSLQRLTPAVDSGLSPTVTRPIWAAPTNGICQAARTSHVRRRRIRHRDREWAAEYIEPPSRNGARILPGRHPAVQRFAWVTDRYGISWRINLRSDSANDD
jgi:hypothetical protein